MIKQNRHCEEAACPPKPWRRRKPTRQSRAVWKDSGLLRCARNDGCGKGQSGSALVYILIAIALLAALTMAFMNPSSNQTTSQNTFKTTSEMQTQSDFIRSAIQECVLTYSGGDMHVISAYGANRSHNYPLMPSDVYFTSSCVPLGGDGSDGNDEVSNLRCPGNPGDHECHADMFGGATGKFLPPAPSLFEAWKYYNGADGIFIWTKTANTDAFLDTVLDKLDAGFSFCEADIMKPTAGDFQMTSDMGAGVACPDEERCFRIWLKINPTALYEPGRPENDAAGDECP